MFSKEAMALAAALSTASATVYQGFNYGSGLDYATEFALAKDLVGTNGAFTSARLYTMIESGTTDTPTSAIAAAIDADVTLLLGLWASGGAADFAYELAALKSAISTYGTSFTKLVSAISVGSEDLYRISPTGVENDSGVGAEPSTLVDYIAQVRAAIAGTDLSAALVGHVDTYNSWTNSSNAAVITACDFLGMDAYPYYQSSDDNTIANAYDLFFSAYDLTVAAAGDKPVWVTETGWPVSGESYGDATAGTANAKTYWDAVGCKLFGTTNTYWYTLEDSGADPSFGVTTGSTTPLYDLTCSASSSSSSSSTATSTSASSTKTGAAASTTATSAKATATAESSATKASTTVTSAASEGSTTSQALVSVSSTVTASGKGSPADSTFSSADSSATAVESESASAYASAVATASSIASAAGTGSVASSLAASASATGVSGSSNGTSTTTGSVTSYTGGASTVRSTGGFVAAVVALLAVL